MCPNLTIPHSGAVAGTRDRKDYSVVAVDSTPDSVYRVDRDPGRVRFGLLFAWQDGEAEGPRLLDAPKPEEQTPATWQISQPTILVLVLLRRRWLLLLPLLGFLFFLATSATPIAAATAPSAPSILILSLTC